MGKSFKSLEESLFSLRQASAKNDLAIEKIIQILSGRGKVFIVMLLAIPFCQPLQIPGLSAPFGIVIALIGLRMAFGKRVWLPKKFLNKKISAAKIQKMTDRLLCWVSKMKKWVHLRWTWMCRSRAMKITNGFAICFLGLFLALPLPIPFSNLTAAWAIFLLAFGILEDDGLFVILGYLVLVITAVVFAFLLTATIELAK